MHQDSRKDPLECERFRSSSGTDLATTLTADESAHLVECDFCAGAMVTAALERKPNVNIPDDFAAHLSASLPEPRSHSRKAISFSRLSALFCLALALLILGAFLVIDPRPFAGQTWTWLTLECVVACEGGGLAWWIARQGRSR